MHADQKQAEKFVKDLRPKKAASSKDIARNKEMLLRKFQ